jgi:hypothetical protein
MTLPLNTTGEEHVSWLPSHLQEDPWTMAFVDALALEVDRVDTDWQFVFEQMFIQTASGWGLELWEKTLGLEVSPTTLTEQQRRDLCLVKKSANSVRSGSEFRALLDQYLDEYEIQVDYDTATLQIFINFSEDVYTKNQVEIIISEVTPAALVASVQFYGFYADISEAGDAL